MSVPSAGGGTHLLTGLPPGWLEVAAFADDAEAAAHVDAMIAVDAGRFDERSADLLRGAARDLRAAVADEQWLHYGLVATEMPHDPAAVVDLEQAWRTTVWSIGIGLVRTPPLHDVDPVAVVERCLGRVPAVDEVAPFQLDDGRHGVALGMSVPVSGWDPGAAVAAALPQLDAAGLAVWACLLPVPGLPEHLGLTVAVAPSLGERNAAAWLASQVATSLHAVDDVSGVPADLVLADLSGERRSAASVLTSSAGAA